MVILIAALISILAYSFKNTVLHMVGMLAWLAGTYYLYNTTGSTPNPYMPTALALIAIAMLLSHLASFIIGIMSWLKKRAPARISYEQDQQSIKRNVYKRTKRRNEW